MRVEHLNSDVLNTIVPKEIKEKVKFTFNDDKGKLDALIKMSNIEVALRHFYVTLVCVCDQTEADQIRDSIFLDITYLTGPNDLLILILTGSLRDWKQVFQQKKSNSNFVNLAYSKFTMFPQFMAEVKPCQELVDHLT